MARVWIVTGECGDYYCGCGNGHILAICSTPELAGQAVEIAKEATHSYRLGVGTSYPSWNSVTSEPFEINVMPTLHEIRS